MATEAPKTAEDMAGELERDYADFQAIVTVLRDAIKGHSNAQMVATNTPLSPGLLLAALLGEASTVCLTWGVTQGLRPNEIEETFDHALRNARRTLRGNLHQLVSGASEQN